MSNENKTNESSSIFSLKTVGYLAGVAALAGAGYYAYKKFFENEEETFVEDNN